MKFGKDANKEIREEISKAGLKYYEVAYCIGVEASTFTKWLQVPLDLRRKDLILKAIKEMKK